MKSNLFIFLMFIIIAGIATFIYIITQDAWFVQILLMSGLIVQTMIIHEEIKFNKKNDLKL